MRRAQPLVLAWRLTVVAVFAAGCSAPVRSLPSSASPQSDAGHGIVIRNQHHRVYKNLTIVTTSGDCVQVEDSYEITIETSQIGPCGGNGVAVNGGEMIAIYDSYIHPQTRSSGCCDHNDGVLLQNAKKVTVWGNVIAYGESNVEAPQGVHGLTVVGNFLLNPRGPYPRGQNVQAWNSSEVLVRNNYTLSSRNTKRYPYPDDQEDSINFGIGSNFVARENYVTGGHSKSGCGLIADDGANDVTLTLNRVVNSGECGIGIASGVDQLVDRNKILNRNPVPGGGNTALYVWNQYKGVPCGPVTVSENVATEVRADGSQSGFWDGGGCNPVARHKNVWDAAAFERLTPVEEKLPPPAIPPEPKHCVIESPYSTQTRWPPCR